MSEFENWHQPRTERSLGFELGMPDLGQVASTEVDAVAEARELAAAAASPERAIALARGLHHRNRQLVERVAELEQVLVHAQQTGALATDGDRVLIDSHQVNALFQELDAAHQVAQRQQNLIETLSHQLDAAQAQIAQLERECALAKQYYADQVELASAAAENSQELRERLDRQKQKVLQFRTSLDRYRSEPEALTPITTLTSLPLAAEPMTPATPRKPLQINADLTAPTPLKSPAPLGAGGRPIRPWSAQLDTEISGLPSPPNWIDRWLDREPGPAATAATPYAAPPNPAPEPPAPAFVPEDDEAIPPEVFSNALREELGKPFYSASDTVAEAFAALEQRGTGDRPTPGVDSTLDVASELFPRSPEKKRQSLAAVELPQFPR